VVPEYVFEDDYLRLSLNEIAAYVRTHKHLPEVPSAKKKEEKGMNVVEMNLLLKR
jgi:hypothetical protein